MSQIEKLDDLEWDTRFSGRNRSGPRTGKQLWQIARKLVMPHTSTSSANGFLRNFFWRNITTQSRGFWNSQKVGEQGQNHNNSKSYRSLASEGDVPVLKTVDQSVVNAQRSMPSDGTSFTPSVTSPNIMPADLRGTHEVNSLLLAPEAPLLRLPHNPQRRGNGLVSYITPNR